jgi:hypothetical protein
MPNLPGDFVPRREIQGIIVRAQSLLPQLGGDLHAGLSKMLEGALLLEGCMSEMVCLAAGPLRDASRWESRWRHKDIHVVGDDGKAHAVQVGFQVVETPRGAVRTGRWSLRLDSQSFVSADRHNLASRLLAHFAGKRTLSAEDRDYLVGQFLED